MKRWTRCVCKICSPVYIGSGSGSGSAVDGGGCESDTCGYDAHGETCGPSDSGGCECVLTYQLTVCYIFAGAAFWWLASHFFATKEKRSERRESAAFLEGENEWLSAM